MPPPIAIRDANVDNLLLRLAQDGPRFIWVVGNYKEGDAATAKP